MQPNFEKMTNKELRAYALAHREDIEALHVLYSRRTPDSEALWFHPPKTKEEEQQQFELFKRIIEEKEGKTRNNHFIIAVTQAEIAQYRSEFADYPEALDAFDLIEENDGDLERTATLLAQEAGIVILRAKPSILDDLAQRFRNIICDEVFINDLMGGVLTAGVGYLTASGQIPTALATALVIYLAKIGVRKFCQSDAHPTRQN